MSLFFKREREVRGLIQRYFETVDEALQEFEIAMRCYLDAGDCDEFRDCDSRVHNAESRADDLRGEIEKKLYSRALLPESRGDILGLLEHFDKMPNLVETITFMCDTQQISIPEAFKPRIVELLEINMEAYQLVRETVDRLFSDPKSVGAAVEPVDAKESESDKLERALIRDVFRSDLDRADMILLRELIARMSDVSDSAENVARRMEIIALKKSI
ncbi:MAG: DUF47 domain-containing protein [Proteobacteria bacterium]|nr:DUF47 domain-containing protein [Pseudomonadota bacterium]